MAKQNVPFLSFTRGIVSPKSLARVDVDRTRLSAAVMRNFLAKTQGAMTIRPGTKYKGNSLNDTGAEWIEFVAATDDVALLELTNDTGTGFGAMRVWLGDDPHDLELLERPPVDTTLSFSDTGWSNASTGGVVGSVTGDLIPTMTAGTTGGVTIYAAGASSEAPWRVGDNNNSTRWLKSGGVPGWLKVNFEAGSGTGKSIGSYSLRSGTTGGSLLNQPSAWRLLGSNFDTGSYATDTGKWTLEDERTAQTGWAASEKRTFTLTDTGTPGPWRTWSLYITALNGGGQPLLAELEMFQHPNVASGQARFSSGQLVLNATAIGSLAKAVKQVVVSDTGTEHSLAIVVGRGPVTLRVGSTNGDDDYISEAELGTGAHNLAFTPAGNFWVTMQSEAVVDRVVESIGIGDSGTVEITTPWTADNLDDIRYDQSADVIYVDCEGVHPQKIERRGTGRSWSVVDYAPNNGPFLPTASSSAKLSVSHFFGNTTMDADRPFFRAGHVGGLVRIFREGQSGVWRLGAKGAKTDAVAVTGIADTGSHVLLSERRIVFTATGTWSGAITIERSFDGEDRGFKPVPADFGGDTGTNNDTGTFSRVITDRDDNVKVWYRARVTNYNSGVANVAVNYEGGGITGIARVTDYNSNTSVGIEILSRFSDTGASDNWQEGYWSENRGFPSSVALHGGRLGHANGGTMFLTVSDDYENFDATIEGDAGPIVRTLGSGPVDNIYWLISLARLIMGTTGAEIQLKSSSFDEPVTPTNSAATTVSTRGSANLRAVKLDNKAIHVQRSGARVFMIGLGAAQSALGDFEGVELTLLAPDLLSSGVVSIAVQRMPDTRLHFVLADGRVGILTYEPAEEVVCWQEWDTDGFVERAMVLPGIEEDAVYYHIRRTVGGATKRFLEKWAKESECLGDTGLSWLADCASSYTDTGRTNTLADIAPHLAGENVVLWGDLDTGGTAFVDLSTDTGSDGSQRLYVVDTGGDITLSLTDGLHHAVAGLPYSAAWKSTKLAYGAQFGTALTMKKRVPQMGFVLYKTHNRGLYMGSDTGTGKLQPLPRALDDDGVVDPDKIYPTLDEVPFAVPGGWKSDSRIALRAKAPRPCTVLAAVPAVDTNEK